MVYPAFGIVFAKGIDGFSQRDPHVRRHDGDRNALWFVISHSHFMVQRPNYPKTGSSLLLSFLPFLSASRMGYSHRLPLN